MKHLLAITILIGCINSIINAQTIAKSFASFKNNALLSNATIALSVIDCNSKQTIFEYNNNTSITPASTLKLFTTISALELLGANYVIKTPVFMDSATGVLHIYPNYDPTWNSENKFTTNFNNQLMAIIKTNKWIIKKAQLHLNPTDARPTNPNWLWGDMGNYFGASPASLNWSDNKLTCYFNTSEINDTTLLAKTLPTMPQLTIVNNTIASSKTGDNTIAYSMPNQATIVIDGELPHHKTNYDVEVSNPLVPQLFIQDLKQLLRINDVDIKYDNLNKTIGKAQYISSPKLSEIIYVTNLKSLNLYAECILKQIALQKKWSTTPTETLKQLLNYWQTKFSPLLNIQGLDVQDGCGLSPMNKVNTEFQTQLLLYTAKTSYYNIIKESLPVMAQSGSLSNMCKGTVAAGNIVAKTGYIHGVRAYSGYVTTLTNKQLAFSFIIDLFHKSLQFKVIYSTY
jgi:serine-type D-Ala-D-Ala carboxypeptidase/endopeptidase (penicillin-binding protein 4)